MRRMSIVALLVMVAIAAGVGGVLQPSARAQDASPAADEGAEIADAATFRALAAGTIEVLAPGTASVVLGRISLPPGASLPFDPNDPSAIMFYVSSGALTFTVDVPMAVARASTTGTPTPPEEFDAGMAFTLNNGDSAIVPGAMGGEIRNDGDEDATAWMVDIVHVMDEAATPTP